MNAYERYLAFPTPQCAAEVMPLKRDGYEPILREARMLRGKRKLVLNWFRVAGKLSSGIVEGFNNTLKLITRTPYGFRTQEAYDTALHHNLRALPERKFTDEFSCTSPHCESPSNRNVTLGYQRRSL